MSTTLRRCSTRAYRAAKIWHPSCARRSYSEYTFKENDIVLLQKKSDPTASQILSKPLRPGKKINTARGTIYHDDIIGKPIRSLVSDKKGEYRLYEPTLGEYANLTPRIVTPVYPADANLIVSLLDLNPRAPRPDDDTSNPLEVFEAGTGHGALTLHLARAINGANPAPPPLPPSDPSSAADPAQAQAAADAWAAYLPTRRAVVHSLDISAKHSAHAQGIVRGFRHGMYAHDVDFHVGSIVEYLESRVAGSAGGAGEGEPFLEHAILDLPDCHDFLGVLGKALRPNGTLIVFCPSLTQIISCLQSVRDADMPFLLETTLEIGQGAGVGGRQWDVRAVRPRALVKAEEEKLKESPEEEIVVEVGAEAVEEKVEVKVETRKTEGEGWNMVCRPKVGGRVVGGGFLGVFRRLNY